MSTESTSGRLLVATPAIEDGVFHRSVVLVLHHDEDGAQGVVLNKPIDASVDSVLPGWGDHVTPPQRLFQGGPVQLDSALGLVAAPGAGQDPLGVRRLFGSLGVLDLDTPPALLVGDVAGVRIFAGYAGWSPRQLDGEIRSGSWYVVDAESADAFSDHPEDLWVDVLRRQAGPVSWVATLPEDPSLN